MDEVFGDPQLDFDRAVRQPGVADRVGDELGGQQAHVLRQARAELVRERLERGGDVARCVAAGLEALKRRAAAR